ncbi:MAG: SRPBCC family protein [Fibrobacteria bacterium]
MSRFERHEEHGSLIDGPMERLFEYLDDQTHLTDHMSKPSWKMGWGRMVTELDDRKGRSVGSYIHIHGRVFGMRLFVDEIVTEREPPLRKVWETAGEPRLLVIGPYRMGFNLEPENSAVRLRVTLHYDLPAKGMSRLLGLVFGKAYAKWCTRQMAEDAQRHFNRHSEPILRPFVDESR